jgi:carboxypeptidase C (cathepsin A)
VRGVTWWLVPAVVTATLVMQAPTTGPTPPAKASQTAEQPAGAAPADAGRSAPADEEPVVTDHELRAGGRTLRYTATTGYLPIRNATSGDIEARIFFIAYTLDGGGKPPQRPLTISFNGGPGSSSVWLHLGALGARRVRLNDDGTMPAPPYALVDNEATWLDQTDLATPYFATEYTLNHLGLDQSLRDRMTRRYYRAGHMMYIDVQELAALRRDVAAFLREAGAGR